MMVPIYLNSKEDKCVNYKVMVFIFSFRFSLCSDVKISINMEFNLYVNGNIHKCDEERVWESFQNGKKIRANFVELSRVMFLFKRQDKMIF